MDRIYLDHNASTPVAPEVVEAMQPFLGAHFGNPSSHHWAGAPARDTVERARGQVAGLLGCAADEVVFTSGGTEANNHAIKGASFALRAGDGQVITTAIEHPAVVNPCRFLERLGAEVTVLPVDGAGRVDPADVARAITPRTILVSVMHANNEVGTVQPIREIAHLARERGVLFHTDAAQSAGKIPVRVGELGVDLLSVAGHKLGAPKGVGALYIRRGVRLEPLMHGAGHESGRRAGTENVLLDVALGQACEIAGRDPEGTARHLRAMRDALLAGLQSRVGDVRVNGDPTHGLPNTLSLGFGGIDAHALLEAVADRLAVSAGSACHAGSVTISPVLRAMGVPDEWARGTIRLSTGRTTTLAEIDAAVAIVADEVERMSGQPGRHDERPG